jgi:hypothetical protein
MKSWVEQLRTKLIKDNEIYSLTTLEEYEPHITDLFDQLDSKGFVNKEEYSQDIEDRLKKLIKISNETLQFADSYHYIIAICQGYQVMSEILKKHLIIFINFNAMNYNASNKALGTLLKYLQEQIFNGKEGRLNKNVFIDNLSVKIRNSIAHYTYYFENNKIYFCKNIYDDKPIKMNPEQFRQECNELNCLAQLILIIFHDKYHPGGKLLLNGTV